MPITPLHLGLMAPINHFKPGKVSNVAFVLANLWLDAEFIKAWLFNMPLPSHNNHDFVNATVAALLVCVLGLSSRKPFLPNKAWVVGAFLGSYTHILLDMLVHADVHPLWPLMDSNPFYMGWMQPLSLVLLVLCVWLTAQYVSGGLGRMRKRWEAFLGQKTEP